MEANQAIVKWGRRWGPLASGNDAPDRAGINMDIVRDIIRFNEGRDPERLRLKYSKMRGDPFVFLRGTCHLFYARLPLSGVFKSAPLTWSCGDLHLENLGSYKGDNRLAYFDLNDFDEGILAPASWDLVRMLTSLRVGAKTLGVSQRDVQSLDETFLDHYGLALLRGKAYWVEHRTAQGLIRQLLDSLSGRPRKDFLDARTTMKGRKRVLDVSGKRALPASAQQIEQVRQFMHEFAASQHDPSFYDVVDVARRIAGTGSLGVDRYAILVRGKGSPDGNYLLDLKEALPSALARRVRVKQPKWASEAHRVVSVQQRMQAVSMAFLQPVVMQGRSYVLRGLQPMEDRVTLDGARQDLADIRHVVACMGRIVAWAQLRSSGRQGSATADELMEFAGGKKWKAKLLEAAMQAERHTLEDAATFAQAYDDGMFGR